MRFGRDVDWAWLLIVGFGLVVWALALPGSFIEPQFPAGLIHNIWVSRLKPPTNFDGMLKNNAGRHKQSINVILK